MFCPETQDGSPMPAFQITYSFRAAPMASDETGSTHFSFSVYFHPEDLSPTLRQEISARRISRSKAAAFFDLTTQPSFAQAALVDEPESSFCDSNNIDGSLADPKCEDKVVYKTVNIPASYLTVKVSPLEQRLADATQRH